jgi:hypothetical protein
MGISKVILIVIGSGLFLFIGLLVYTLSPTIRNVSDKSFLRDLLNRPLTLKRNASIYFCKSGYDFKQLVLSETRPEESELKYEVPAGSIIKIQKFKTYKSGAGSGFSYLFALGEFTTLDDEKVEFEYCWGGTDPSFYSNESALLPLAVWQDETNSLIRYEKD